MRNVPHVVVVVVGGGGFGGLEVARRLNRADIRVTFIDRRTIICSNPCSIRRLRRRSSRPRLPDRSFASAPSQHDDVVSDGCLGRQYISGCAPG